MVELGEHCHTHIIPRLKKVIDGDDPGGITEAVGWKGGGGFRYYRLAPSLIENDTWGNWVINKEYNAAMLAEALCKLEGFTYAPSETVYWQHGRSTERDFIYVTTQTLARAAPAAQRRSRRRAHAARALHGVPRQCRPLSEPDGQEDPQRTCSTAASGARTTTACRSPNLPAAPPEARAAKPVRRGVRVSDADAPPPGTRADPLSDGTRHQDRRPPGSRHGLAHSGADGRSLPDFGSKRQCPLAGDLRGGARSARTQL